MKAFFLLIALGVAAISSAQAPDGSSPASANQNEKMIGMAVTKASSALKAGKKVSITVDNRTVTYVPKLINGMVYVPIRLFQETGQTVVWNAPDMRATLRSENGSDKASIDFDAKVARATNKPSPGMRPVYEGGRVWVPLAAGLAPFGHLVDWVPTSNRLNIRTFRGR